MLHVNSIALLSVSLNLATRVLLFTNLRFRFVGAENHHTDHWRGHGTSMSWWSISKMRVSFMVTFVSVIHSWSHKKSWITQLTLSMKFACPMVGFSCVHRTEQPWYTSTWTRQRTIPPIFLHSILVTCPLLPSNWRKWLLALRRRVCLTCGLARICSTLTPLLWLHESSFTFME